MGFQDRDYYRDNPYDDGSFFPSSRGGPWAITTWLLIVNIAVFLIDGVFFGNNHLLMSCLSLYGRSPEIMEMIAKGPKDLTFFERIITSFYGGSLFQPHLYWQFVTYGFAHSPNGIWHILGNMLVLFFFGYSIEERLGRWRFLRFYLTSIIFCGLVYALLNLNRPFVMLGASGAITTLVILYALWYPHRLLYLWFVLPVPAWILGVLFVVFDAYGAISGGNPERPVAYVAHLAGAGFAVFYCYFGWKTDRALMGLASGFAGRVKKLKPKRGPKVKIYRPEEDETPPDDLAERVDAVLKKIAKSGEASLTSEERKLLQRASKTYKDKHSR